MSRVFLIVMDSVGCGGAPDAKDFGDEEISLENIELLKKQINQTKKL